MAAFVMATAPIMPCGHKAEIGCVLTALPSCCACADKRPLATAYPIYIDGEGMKNSGRRWQMYCWKCRDYYNHQFEAASISSNLPPQNSTSLGLVDMAYQGEFQVHRAATPMASPSLQDRMTSHLNAISISDDALPTDPDANSSRQSSGYNRPPAQTQRAEPVYPLGTREEVQAEDYQSPIAGMFGRAWSRFRIAEEVRQAERAMNPEAPVFAYSPAQTRPSLSSHPAIPSVVMPQSNPVGFQAQYAGNGMPVVMMNGMSHMAQQYPTAFFQGHPASGDHLIQATSRQHLAPHGMPAVMYANPFVRPPDEEPEQYDEEHEHGDEYDDLQPSAIDRQTQRPEPLTEEQKIANIACKVCCEQRIDTLTEPCMHIATCHWCAQIWEEEYRRRRMNDPHAKHRCVVCRRTVKNTRRVYLP